MGCKPSLLAQDSWHPCAACLVSTHIAACTGLFWNIFEEDHRLGEVG